MSDIERQQLEEWEVCPQPTFISGIEGEAPDFQAVVNQRFPNQVGTLAEAEVAFLNYATAHAHLDALGDFYNRGGLIVMMRPTETGFDSLGDDYLDDGDDGEDEAATNGNFPAITHTEFSLNTAWMWRLPMNKKIHVADNEETSFYLCVFVKPCFASWYHWRATAQFDGNKRTYNGYQGICQKAPIPLLTRPSTRTKVIW